MESARSSARPPSEQHVPSHPQRPRPCGPDVTDPKRNRLLGALGEAVIQRWLPELEAVEMPLAMVTREPGLPQQHVYFPTTSIVALMFGLEDGRTAAVSVVGNEGIVGLPTFMGGGRALGSTVVLSAGQGYRLPAATLTRDFELGGSVTHLLLRYIQAVMAQLAQVVVCNRHHTLEHRLCRFLLSTMDRLDDRTEFMMTHERIASVLGVRREGVTEAAVNLQRSGLLRYRRGRIAVLDRAGLAHRSCECHGVVKTEYERLLPPASIQ